MSPPARLLAIAGSDPSGGAGLQADLKTCAAFGVYGMTAVTAITVQNTLGVSHVEVLSADLVVAQIRAVLEDMGTDVIKIGMLGRAETVEAVADVLDELAPETPIVLDPVMLATSGGRLLEEKAVNTLKQHLLPMADL
ncbi:MAG TPA: hydroxymethylpyrimidine/phosphomethylpyrimidine kinase, partial [Hellea balneolensis]|nr:hydroxymethylpyrimidine/phosphomethylpyrimidine kinase [Hellea balneolensis]